MYRPRQTLAAMVSFLARVMKYLLYRGAYVAPAYQITKTPATAPSPMAALDRPKRVAAACMFSNRLPLPLPPPPPDPAWVGSAVGDDDGAPGSCDGSTAFDVVDAGAEADVLEASLSSVLVAILPVDKVSGPMTIGTTSCSVRPSPSVVVWVNMLVVVSRRALLPFAVVVGEYSALRVVVDTGADVAVAQSYALSMMDWGIASPEAAQKTCRGANKPKSSHAAVSHSDLTQLSEFWRYESVALASHMPVQSVCVRGIFDCAILTLLRGAAVAVQAVLPAVVQSIDPIKVRRDARGVRDKRHCQRHEL